ncbi:hypothetical protein N2152v2_011256 [Parachlorella kessleri]
MSGEDQTSDYGVDPDVRPRILDPAAAAPKAVASMAEAPYELEQLEEDVPVEGQKDLNPFNAEARQLLGQAAAIQGGSGSKEGDLGRRRENPKVLQGAPLDMSGRQ